MWLLWLNLNDINNGHRRFVYRLSPIIKRVELVSSGHTRIQTHVRISIYSVELATVYEPHRYQKALELATKFLFMHVNRIHSMDARSQYWLAPVGNTKGNF